MNEGKMVGYVNVCIFLSIFAIGFPSTSTEEKSSRNNSTKLSEIVFVVLSQPNAYHADRARHAKIHFMEQMVDMATSEKPAVYLAHKKWPEIGTWTIFPLLKQWASDFPKMKWVFVCEDETRVDLHRLETIIQKYDPNKDWFLGHALRDKEATIIHHFTPPDQVSYPDFAGGFMLSSPLVQKLADRWPDEKFRSDFAIDPKHELASYILMDGVKLTDVPEFCTTSEQPDCVTTLPVKFPKCRRPISDEDMFVAVKTCEKFHKDRVPVVLNTFAKDTRNIEFYSETEDASIPTIDLGVPNTESGHCGKTYAIMKRAVTESHIKSKKWLLIADDDTIINLKRLRQLLSCYDASKDIALGERYGYQVSKGYGYDYITGGGGMIFSMSVVQRLVDECRCPADDSPDDMIIGMCLRRMDIDITHVPYIHQARPDDYSEGYLSRQIPISFHKHWNNDPYQVYQLLKSYDETSKQSGGTNKASKDKKKHEEL